MTRRFIVLSLLILLFASTSQVVTAQVYNNPNSGGQSPAKALELYNRAKEAFRMQDWNACIQICKAAKNFDHGNKDIFHLQALALAEHGDNYNAMMEFRAALSLDYNFLECRNNYGTFLKKTGKVKEAKKEFKECIKINPNYAQPHYHLGEILQLEGDLDGAIEEYRTAVNLKPEYPDAQRDLALALNEKYEKGELKSISESLEHLQTAARLLPNNPMIHWYIGRIWCNQGNLDEAEKEYRLSLMNDPNLAAGHFELGRLRYHRGDLDRTRVEMQAALKVSPVYTKEKNYPGIERKVTKTYLAKAFEYKGYLVFASREWKDVASLTYDNAPIYKHIDALAKQWEKNEKAKKKKNTPQIDRDEVQALLERGIGEVDGGNLPGAMKSFVRASELNPQCFEAHQYIGGILEQQGDLTRAMERYQQALALNPGYDGLYYNMAFVLEKMHLPVEAGRMYKKFHNLAGRYPYDPKHIIDLQLQDVREQMRQKDNQSGF